MRPDGQPRDRHGRRPSVELADLASVGGDVVVVGVVGLETLSLPLLSNVNGSLTVVDAADLTTLSLPALVTVENVMITGSAIATCEGAVLVGENACSAVPFATHREIGTGSTPTSVAIGDVDGDGVVDLAVASADDVLVSVLRGAAQPADAFSTRVDFPTGASPHCVILADVSGDGKPELVVANTFDQQVAVLKNNSVAGAPSFAAPLALATGVLPTAVAAGDLNGDGLADLVVARSTDSSAVSTLVNTTASNVISFAAAVDFPTDDGSASVALGDINSDGKLDIVLANFNTHSMTVLLNQTAIGSPTLNFASSARFQVVATPGDARIVDVNADGKLDVVVANGAFSTLTVFINTTASGAAAPTFAAGVDFPTADGPSVIAVADLDEDGKPDLAVANTIDNNVSLLLNTTAAGGAPAFLSAGALPIAGLPGAAVFAGLIAASDLDGDGNIDLAVVGNVGSSSITLLTSLRP